MTIFTPRGKVFLGLTLLMAAGMVLFPEISFAQQSDVTTTTEAQITSTMIVVFKFLNFLLYPILVMISALMDNEVLIGPEMESKLLQIWVEIRNWVNIIFVLILVGIALYNVLGVADEGSNYALKAILPKMVIGLVAVNFSFLAGKLVIDATAVVTTAVYALPTQLMDWDKEKAEVEIRLCTQNRENAQTNYEVTVVEPRKIEDGNIAGLLFCAKEAAKNPVYFTGQFNSFGANFFNNFGQHNVAAVMMVNMGLISDATIIPSEGTLQSLANLTFNMLFGALMFLVFGFSYVALAVVLLARLVVLWICLALSPLVILLFVFPDIASLGGNELDLKTQFFKHLFAPLVIGIVFSVGFTMLKVLQGSSSGSWMGALGEKEFSSLGDTQNVTDLVITYGKDISNFQELLIAAGAVVIIWVGVFAAASQTVASGIVQTIKSAGESTGKFLASAPVYATVIPIPGLKGKADLGTILSLPRALKNEYENRRQEKLRKFMRDDLKIGETPATKAKRDLLSDLGKGSRVDDEKRIHQYLKKTPDVFDNPEDVREVLQKFASANKDKNLEDTLEKLSNSEIERELKGGKLHEAIFRDSPRPTDFDTWGKAKETPATKESPAQTSANKHFADTMKQLGGLQPGANFGKNKEAAQRVAEDLSNVSHSEEKLTGLFAPATDPEKLKRSITQFRNKTSNEKQAILQNTSLMQGGKLDPETFINSTEGNPPQVQPPQDTSQNQGTPQVGSPVQPIPPADASSQPPVQGGAQAGSAQTPPPGGAQPGSTQ